MLMRKLIINLNDNIIMKKSQYLNIKNLSLNLIIKIEFD